LNDTLRLAVSVLDSSLVFAELFNGSTFPPQGWTAINRDGGVLPPWFQGTPASVFPPYEGGGFAANNFQRANGTYIDDYLVSPAISGVGQPGVVDSLGFMARSVFNPPPAMNYPDSLMVLLSTTGIDTADFSIVLDYFSVPKSGWTLKRYDLTSRVPSNSTIHIAFRYLHYEGGPPGTNSDFMGVDFVHVKRSFPTNVETPSPQQPHSFDLSQNYPNPFNPTTKIRFRLEVSGFTRLRVCDVLGNEVATLVNEVKLPGSYEVTWNGVDMASGVYFYVLTSGSETQTKMMMVLR
jgi:hypothetical protein